MRLEPTAQQQLLSLAELERATAAAGNRPRTTPEQDELARVEKAHDRERAALAAAKLAVTDMEAEILRIQEDERRLRARERDDKNQLTAEVDPERRKDLEHDRYAAKSRIADLMGELMECHNEVHPLRDNVARLEASVAEWEEKVDRARKAVEEAEAPADPRDEIARLKEQVDPEALAEYEERRAENEVGVARFNGRSCSGCFMVLPASERAAIHAAAPEVLPECPNCGSFLVRVLD